MSDGPPRDGIRSLDYPVFVTAVDATYLKRRDRVLGVSIKGVARAYPIRILNYHEIVNDVVGGTAVAITYCPLCGTGTAFEATINGDSYEFGVSGLLYNSDVLMYDRNTGSLWSQLMVQAVTGPMKGTRLQQLPLSHTSWQDWLERHPETEVLSNKTGYSRNYRVDPYPNYGSLRGAVNFNGSGTKPNADISYSALSLSTRSRDFRSSAAQYGAR